MGRDGDVVWGAANWTAKGRDAKGNPQNLGGIATHVFERQDNGDLKIKLHAFN